MENEERNILLGILFALFGFCGSLAANFMWDTLSIENKQYIGLVTFSMMLIFTITAWAIIIKNWSKE